MAQLRNCRTCQELVAKNAVLCPSCGRTNPAPGVIRKTVNGLFTLLLLGIPVALILAGLASGEG